MSFACRLALAVIERAFLDAMTQPWAGLRRCEIADARRFLSTPNPDLAFWCGVAGLTEDAVIRRFRARRIEATRRRAS